MIDRSKTESLAKIDNTYGWDYAPDDTKYNYILKCKLFAEDDKAFFNFRQDEDYKKILEGGERIVGRIHLDRIKKLYGLDILLENIDLFRENDIYGNPTILDYEEVKKINPCTILYVSQALDIKKLLGDIVPKKIVEIGRGFGALCKTISVLYDFDEYILFDLPEVISLCKKYIKNFPELYEKVTFITSEEFEDINDIKDVDVFIAAASLAECNKKTQDNYINKVLLNSKVGYIIYNTLHISEAVTNYESLIKKTKKYFNIHTEQENEVAFMYFRKKRSIVYRIVRLFFS